MSFKIHPVEGSYITKKTIGGSKIHKPIIAPITTNSAEKPHVKGSIIYNNNQNELEYSDGKCWKPISKKEELPKMEASLVTTDNHPINILEIEIPNNSSNLINLRIVGLNIKNFLSNGYFFNFIVKNIKGVVTKTTQQHYFESVEQKGPHIDFLIKETRFIVTIAGVANNTFKWSIYSNVLTTNLDF